MTYTGKQEHFECDYCGKQSCVPSGLPQGWCWVKTGGKGVRHACQDCRQHVPKKAQREAGQKN